MTILQGTKVPSHSYLEYTNIDLYEIHIASSVELGDALVRLSLGGTMGLNCGSFPCRACRLSERGLLFRFGGATVKFRFDVPFVGSVVIDSCVGVA